MSKVKVGDVTCFKNPKADKEQACKIIEEAAEVFGAWQMYDACDDGDSLAQLTAEMADLIQAVCNMAYALGVDDMTTAMSLCRYRNIYRGRI